MATMVQIPYAINSDEDPQLCRNRKYSLTMRERARTLRKEQTNAEKLLWTRLRNRQLGVVFRRQHAIATIILDFYAPKNRLGIEVDGGIHTTLQIQDRMKEEILAGKGVQLLRFTNEEVFTNLDGVVQQITSAIPRE
jgi:very-short-patch-repair endonuclease